MTLFSGSSHKLLSQSLAQKMQIKLGEIELSSFSNDEVRVWVKEKKIDKQTIILQSLHSPVEKNLVEFALICDALQRNGAQELIGVIPWLGYSKQDKVFRVGEPLSVKVIAKMLQVVPIRKLFTFDLHNLAILGFFEIPVINLTARPLFVEYFKTRVTARTIVVAPDAGAVKSTTAFAQELGVPVVYLDKKRDLVTGEVTIHGSSSSVEDADVLIIDDLIVTGSTLIETAKYLKKNGAASIAVGATHHLYVPGVQEKLDASEIDICVVSNTVEQQVESKKLKVLDISPILSQALLEE